MKPKPPQKKPLKHTGPMAPATAWHTAYARAMNLLPTLRKDPQLKTVAGKLAARLEAARHTLQEASHLEKSKWSNKARAAQVLRDLQGRNRDLQELQDELLERHRREREEALAEHLLDEAKSQYEATKEQLRLAMRILCEHMERQIQVVSKITS